MLRNKLLWGSVRAIATGKRRNGISCHVDQAVQGVWTRWTLEVEREGRAVVFSLRALQRHAMVAKLIAGLTACSALPDTCEFVLGLEAQGSMEPQMPMQAPTTANWT